MRYWFDTEFHEEQNSLELISIGLVAEDGRAYYAESSDYDWGRAHEWLIKNVKPHLVGGNRSKPRKNIAAEIKEFIGEDGPEFWGYFADYDWVLFCWLFGRMIDMPKNWPMFCRDVMQLAELTGFPRKHFANHNGKVHNALDDALWTKEVWEQIVGSLQK